MFRALEKLFGRRDRLSALSRQADRRAFVRAIVESDVIVLAALQSDGLDTANLTKEDLLAEIEKAAKDLSERDTFEPLLYRSGDSQRLPFFSTPDHAQAFCTEYTRERNRVFPFQTLTIRGSVLASMLPKCDALVLNARTADEYVLSPAETESLRELA